MFFLSDSGPNPIGCQLTIDLRLGLGSCDKPTCEEITYFPRFYQYVIVPSKSWLFRVFLACEKLFVSALVSFCFPHTNNIQMYEGGCWLMLELWQNNSSIKNHVCCVVNIYFILFLVLILGFNDNSKRFQLCITVHEIQIDRRRTDTDSSGALFCVRIWQLFWLCFGHGTLKTSFNARNPRLQLGSTCSFIHKKCAFFWFL